MIKKIIIYVMFLVMLSVVVTAFEPDLVWVLNDTSGADAYLSEINSNNNFGASAVIFQIGRAGGGQVSRGILNFTQACNEIGIREVQEMVIQLKTASCDGTPDSRFDFFPLNETWEENTLDNSAGDVSWNEVRTGVAWSGGAGANRNVDNRTPINNESFNITFNNFKFNTSLRPSYINSVCNGTSLFPNGLMVRDTTSENETSTASRRCGFVSSENGVVADRPTVYFKFVEIPNAFPNVSITSPSNISTINESTSIEWATIDETDFTTNVTISNATFFQLLTFDLSSVITSFLFNTSIISNGIYTIAVLSSENDTAELQTGQDTIQITIANSIDVNDAPVVTISNPLNNSIINTTSTSINWTVQDNEDDTYLSNITLSNSTFEQVIATGLNNTFTSFFFDFSTIANGNYMLTVTSREDATPELLLGFQDIFVTLQFPLPPPPAQVCVSDFSQDLVIVGFLVIFMLLVIGMFAPGFLKDSKTIAIFITIIFVIIASVYILNYLQNPFTLC